MRLKLKIYFLLTSLLLLISQDSFADAKINIYQYTQANMLSPAAKNALYRVYVPNSRSNSVSVIDPTTYQVIQTIHTGAEPQHVVPAYDLQTLWVLNNKGNNITAINPATGKFGPTFAVDDPYNLYFTPNGKFAIVVCEGREELQFRDPVSMKLITSLKTGCRGANHMEFSVDGAFAIVTCEHSSQLMKVDLINNKVLSYLVLNNHQTPSKVAEMDILGDGNIHFQDHSEQSMPQDIRSTADGKLFFVADMMRDGVAIVDPVPFIQIGFIPTGIGAHAVYPSRDGKLFYISNRGCHHSSCGPHGPGSISVIDPDKKAVIATWAIPKGGSPDMGNVTADGKELWLSGRYDSEVYVFDTTTGQLTHRIPVGTGPHGLTVWPQPGRYSLGHTGNMR